MPIYAAKQQQAPRHSALRPSPLPVAQLVSPCSRPGCSPRPHNLHARVTLALSCVRNVLSQMILATVSGQLDASTRVCGTEPDVLPPLSPPLLCFQQLSELLQFVAAGGVYELMQVGARLAMG